MKTSQKEIRMITIKELKQHLAAFPDHYEVDFSGLEFYRTKGRGENIVQIEFNEQVFHDENGDVVIQNL